VGRREAWHCLAYPTYLYWQTGRRSIFDIQTGDGGKDLMPQFTWLIMPYAAILKPDAERTAHA